MSEGSGTHSTTKPESQSIRGCAQLREDCQSKTFKKIDDTREKLEIKMDSQHKNVMKVISSINEKLAFQEGKESAPSITVNNKNGKRDFKQFMMQAIIAWGPWIAMIFGLGIIALLKSKGVL